MMQVFTRGSNLKTKKKLAKRTIEEAFNGVTSRSSSRVFTVPKGMGVVGLKPPTAKLSVARRFVLERKEDFTGTSGTGTVAEGIQFSNGQVALHWLSQLETVAVYANILTVDKLHGHDGRTSIVWVDE